VTTRPRAGRTIVAGAVRLIARFCRRATGLERNTASVNSQTSTPRRDANPAPPPHELRGRWLTLARITWLAIVLATAVILVASVPAYFSVLHDVCHSQPCIGGQLLPAETRALGDLGLPIGFYAAYVLTLDLLVVMGFCSVGAIIFWRKSRERAALFASFALVMFGLTWPGAFESARRYPGWGEPVGGFLFELGLASLVVLLLVFPNGRFVPRWTRWVAAFALVQLAWSALFPASFLADPPQMINVPAFVGLWAICSFAQAYRYLRVSGPIERQQVKWLVFGVAALVALLCAFFLTYALFPTLNQPGVVSLTYDLAGRFLVGSFAFLLIPLSIGVAILRYRLYDIDILINRTLVYGSLTVTLALVYTGSVVVWQQLFRVLTGQGSQLAVVASTLAIAALFSPLRHRVQSFIDRRFYRRKYDARKTLEGFSAKLRDETDLDALSNDLTSVVRETMQPARVSLWMRPDWSAEDKARGEQRP
jgi:hypothetical protein